MGGGRYDGDVARQARSTNRNVFTYAGYSTRTQANEPAAPRVPTGFSIRTATSASA
jgi:hypothetical protein